MGNTTKTRKVISLVRVSDKSQADDDRTGIPRQLDDIATHCQTHNLEVVQEYRLTGLSGANVEHSRQFQEMLSKLSQSSIAGLVFATVDRFFRPEFLSSFNVLKPIERTGKKLFCDLGELDVTDTTDMLKVSLYGQFAGMERKRIKDRMVRGKEKNRHRADMKTDTLPKGVGFK